MLRCVMQKNSCQDMIKYIQCSFRSMAADKFDGVCNISPCPIKNFSVYTDIFDFSLRKEVRKPRRRPARAEHINGDHLSFGTMWA